MFGWAVGENVLDSQGVVPKSDSDALVARVTGRPGLVIAIHIGREETGVAFAYASGHGRDRGVSQAIRVVVRVSAPGRAVLESELHPTFRHAGGTGQSGLNRDGGNACFFPHRVFGR